MRWLLKQSSETMEPGDQKVFGPTAFGSPTSRCANRCYTVILFVVAAGGVGCLFIEEWITGGILTVVGAVGGVLFLRSEVLERRMARRMLFRDAGASSENSGRPAEH